jgi:WD40 repeat protein
VLRGHRDWVLGGYFGRHSDQILTVSRDGTARIWNPDGSYLMTLRGHNSWVTAACFGEKDSCVFTASADHTVRRWLVTEAGLVSLMNKHAVRELSAHERAVYLNFEHS